jgi:hypothetical protein
MGIEEGEEVQAKGIHNIVNKIVTENFPNLEKTMPIQVQEASRTPNRIDQNRTTSRHIIIKTTSTENRERILKAVRETKKITYKGKPISITADFSKETLKARRAWSEVFRALNENNCNPRINYPAKLSFKIDKAIKVFHDKQKLKQCMTTNPPLQKTLQGVLDTENESKQNHKRTGSTTDHFSSGYCRGKDKKVERNIDSATHIQTLKQQKQVMTGITTYLSILTQNVNRINSPIKRHCLANQNKKEDPTICCLQSVANLIDRNKHRLRMKV